MSPPTMSAFAMYNANKPNKQERRKIIKKKEKERKSIQVAKQNANKLNDLVLIQASKKLKKKAKGKKDIKTVVKDIKHAGNSDPKIKSKTNTGKAINGKSEFIKAPTVLNSISQSKANFNKDHSFSCQTKNCLDDICLNKPVNDESILTDASDDSIEFTPVETDSAEEGLKVFQWMIAPYNPNEFLNKVWEKKPLHIARKSPLYYKSVISTPIIDNMLRNENIIFTKNIDITSYVDGVRETHNPVGRAHPHVVWDYYLNGCSIRLLNPQTYVPRLHLINATLQEFFNSFVGANAYLTPPDSQGFAPHYDDIEAFILQIEGKKKWRIYKPITESEALPRVSSKNFDQEEIGSPIMEVMLKAGDMLYFPRGFIHQGVTVEGEHSLHITVSMYQKHSWADLFEKFIPVALQAAVADNVELRAGLPFDIYDNFGLVNSDVNTPRKDEIKGLITSMFDKIKAYIPFDAAVDEISKDYQHAALPPVLSDLEKAVTVYGDSDVMMEEGLVTRRVEISLDTRIRLLRKNILRMVMEEDGIRLYYYTENSLEYHGNELQHLEIDENLAPAIETLVTTYPEYVGVENLGIESDSDKMQVANDLWERGLIMTEYPLENLEDD